MATITVMKHLEHCADLFVRNAVWLEEAVTLRR